MLQGLATTLGPVLARLRMAASVAEAVDALAGDIVVVADVGGRWAPTSGEATVSGWDLSLVGRLLRASRVTALIPTATGACRYVEWPGEDSEPARVAARESLTRLLALQRRPLITDDYPARDRLQSAGVVDLLAVPLAATYGEAGVLAFFDPMERPFDTVDTEAAGTLAERLTGSDVNADRCIDLQTLQAAESRRLAGELHDGPVQQLTSAVIESELTLRVLEQDSRGAALSIQNVRDEVRRVISQLRSLIFDLRLANVGDLGLSEALRDYAEDFARTNGLQLDFVVEGEPVQLPESIQQGLFLIAREALLNVNKHARASAVRTAVEFAEDFIAVSVEDNGVGFPVDEGDLPPIVVPVVK